MPLRELIRDLPLRLIDGPERINLTRLEDDSRHVRDGALFIARNGVARDGRCFVEEAVRRGAVAVVSDQDEVHPSVRGRSVAWVVGERIDQALAGQLAERFYGFPSQKLKLIGVTGTNGKTTTSLILAHLLRSAGVHCGVIGTVYVDDGQERRPSRMTTPGAVELSCTLAKMVDHGCRAAVVEVSSHGLEQGRASSLTFDAGVFTNLTGDHLDYHQTMQSYAAAKAMLFSQLDRSAHAVVNADDDYAQQMVAQCPAEVLRCTMGGSDATGRATVLKLTGRQSLVRFDGPWGSLEVRLPLVGRHNVENALLATTAAYAVCGSSPDLASALTSCPPIPGRLERVPVPSGRGPVVLVDYAHTHDALEQVLSCLRPLTHGQLIVLFGCGGDRDRTKRPRMAEIAARLADRVVITSDNPRTESPQAIIEDIRAGIGGGNIRVEPDRARAIDMAIGDADEADTVLLAGKGHEPYQEIGTERYHFDDREQALVALRRRISG